MKDELFAAGLFISGMAIGVCIMLYPAQSRILEQKNTISILESNLKDQPVITSSALGICQVKQGGKTYMLIDITEEIQAAESSEGLEEKHQQITKELGDEK